MRRSDHHLAAAFDLLGRLNADNDMPACEQVARSLPRRSRLRRAAAWSMAALIAVAAVIRVLLSRTLAAPPLPLRQQARR